MTRGFNIKRKAVRGSKKRLCHQDWCTSLFSWLPPNGTSGGKNQTKRHVASTERTKKTNKKNNWAPADYCQGRKSSGLDSVGNQKWKLDLVLLPLFLFLYSDRTPHFSPSTPNFPDLSLPLRQSVLRVSSDIYLDFFHSLSIGIRVRKTKIKIKKEGVGMWTSLPPKVAKSGQLTSLALKHYIQNKKCGLPHHCVTIGFCFVFGFFLTSVCHWV